MASVVREAIVGREQELDDLRVLLDDAASGPAAAVLAGDPGIGKTVLWEAVVASALERGYRVLTARPAEAESKLAFAALGDLLEPVLEETLAGLPSPQRRALEVALLLAETEDAPPDERAVAVGVLSLLRALAETKTVLIAVDDVQWLDSPSDAVLRFVLRRLRLEPVGVLLAGRLPETTRPPLGLRANSVRLGPISAGATHRLLRERLGTPFPRPLLLRIHEASAGNPLYALELGRALSRGDLRAKAGQPLPVPPSLGEFLQGRLLTLPRQTQHALLVAAALSDPRTALVAARPALDPAIAANVIELEGDRIHFAHPLLASVAYAMASETERRGVHRRLAGAVDEPTERARHLAQAAEGPDAAVAVTLERAAETARLRGASAAAAELCEQALALTPPDEIEDVRRRTLIAARYRFVAGDTASARSLLESWLQGARDGGRAEALALLGRLLRYEGDQRGAAEVLRKALAEPAAAEDVRAEAAQGLASTLFFMRDDLELALHYAVVAGELAAASGHAALRQEALVQRGLIEAALGRREGGARLEAAERLVEPARPVQIVGSAQWGRAYFLVWADEPEQAAVIMRRCHDEALSTGDDGSVPMILAGLAFAQYLSGHWQAAATNVEEAYELALQTGQRPQEAYSLSVRALVEASRGAEDRARADAAEALELAGEREMGVARIHALGALGLLHLSLERPADVVQLLAPHRVRLVAAGVAEPGSARFFPDEIEALVELGRLDEARGLLEWFEARAVALDRASALGAAGRCRGLLASALGRQDEALVAFERAIAEHDRVSIPFDRARTLLAHGGALRRAMRKRDARTVLDEALADFDRLGATLYADRTREELGRIGGTTAAAEELTAAEQKVAQLVAQGLTNKEVAAALFVTPKTIEFHLGNVFRKLGVRSRTELARRL